MAHLLDVLLLQFVPCHKKLVVGLPSLRIRLVFGNLTTYELTIHLNNLAHLSIA